MTLTVSQRPNQAPIATPDRFPVTQGQTVRGNVGANDSDPDGDNARLVYRLATQPAFGQLTFNSDGSFAYVAGANDIGETQFTYVVTDERGGTSTGQVTIVVNARVLAPVEITVPSQGGVATGVVWELRNIDVSGTRKYPFPNSTSGISTHDLAGGSFTIKLGTTPVAVGIADSDGRFEDGDLKQVLANNVTINGVFEAAGKRFTPEYSYRVREAVTGRIINIYVVELGSNKAVGIVSDAPLQTGVAYTFISLTSNTPKDLTYNNLADSYIILA
ncbi:MAG TPA: hypothetical protein DDZ51_14770 [Planctomycetaceae bacterium]|nr:hypothetical protein [Planctomycetaceae bacterium]